MVNVKTLNGSEWTIFFFHFFIEIENFRGEGNMLMRHTNDTTFSEANFDFLQILEEGEQFFILFVLFSIFEVRGGNFFSQKFTFWKKWSERIQRTKP